MDSKEVADKLAIAMTVLEMAQDPYYTYPLNSMMCTAHALIQQARQMVTGQEVHDLPGSAVKMMAKILEDIAIDSGAA